MKEKLRNFIRLLAIGMNCGFENVSKGGAIYMTPDI